MNRYIPSLYRLCLNKVGGIRYLKTQVHPDLLPINYEVNCSKTNFNLMSCSGNLNLNLSTGELTHSCTDSDILLELILELDHYRLLENIYFRCDTIHMTLLPKLFFQTWTLTNIEDGDMYLFKTFY